MRGATDWAADAKRYAASQRHRKRIEEVSGWIKTQAGFSRDKVHGVGRVVAAFTMTVAACALRRLAGLAAPAPAGCPRRPPGAPAIRRWSPRHGSPAAQPLPCTARWTSQPPDPSFSHLPIKRRSLAEIRGTPEGDGRNDEQTSLGSLVRPRRGSGRGGKSSRSRQSSGRRHVGPPRRSPRSPRSRLFRAPLARRRGDRLRWNARGTGRGSARRHCVPIGTNGAGTGRVMIALSGHPAGEER
jgi:hypothetical protein